MDPTIRFGVGDTELKRRASTWRCWTPGNSKNDVYISCREIGGTVKVSLHESGSWHFAYTDEFYNSAFDYSDGTVNSRFIEKWSRPPEIAPGVRLAFRIVVPWFSLTSDITSSHAKVVWTKPPSEKRAVEFSVVLTTNAAKVTSRPGARSMLTDLIGSISLSDGSTVWIVSREIEAPSFAEQSVQAQAFKGKSRADLNPGQKLRMIMFAVNGDGSRTLFDLVGSYDPIDSGGT